MRETPPGAVDEGWSGKGMTRKSLQIIGGLPEKNIENIDLGWARININIEGGKPKIEYVHDEEANVGERSQTVGMGKGQIPIEAWEEAKGEGVGYTDFVKAYSGELVEGSAKGVAMPTVEAQEAETKTEATEIELAGQFEKPTPKEVIGVAVAPIVKKDTVVGEIFKTSVMELPTQGNVDVASEFAIAPLSISEPTLPTLEILEPIIEPIVISEPALDILPKATNIGDKQSSEVEGEQSPEAEEVDITREKQVEVGEDEAEVGRRRRAVKERIKSITTLDESKLPQEIFGSEIEVEEPEVPYTIVPSYIRRKKPQNMKDWWDSPYYENEPMPKATEKPLGNNTYYGHELLPPDLGVEL